MELEGSQKIDLEPETLDQAEETLVSETELNASAGSVIAADEVDTLPNLHKSREPERTQAKGRYNLRKSLAWDAAFFTSAGVLDPEELSCMITQADKGEKHSLAGIQEDVMTSTESITSLDRDHLDFETLEEDLFVDIRASIQRSSKKVSNLTNSRFKIPTTEEFDNASISSEQSEKFSSQNKNPNIGSRKINIQEIVKMPTSLQKQNIEKRGSIKQGHSHSKTLPTAKVVEKNLIAAKTLKTISNSISAPTAAKQGSVEAGDGKSESRSLRFGASESTVTGACNGTQLPKVSSGARRALQRPTVLPKPPLLNPSMTSSSISMSSEMPSKSSLMMTRSTAIRAGSANVRTGSSSSKSKTSSRTLLKNKPLPSTLPACLKSTKISASISPASSISEWSSVSSSSSSLVFRSIFNNSTTSLDSSSSLSLDGDTVPFCSRNHAIDQTTDRHHSQQKQSNDTKKPSTGIVHGSLRPPSGLRVPSPKIGFFDGVKASSARPPNGNQQPLMGSRTLLPKNETAASSPIQSSNNKLKVSKVPTAGTETSLSSRKPRASKLLSSSHTVNKLNV